MDTAVQVTVAMFAIGVIYAAGRLTARVESLENWRKEMNGELGKIHDAIRSVRELIRGEET